MSKTSDSMDDVAEVIPVRHKRSEARDDERGAGPAATHSTAPQAEPAQDDAPTVPQIAQEEVQAIARERDEYYDRLLRKTAEFDNYRKRIERERREQADHAAASVLEELLPLVDNLERALQADATNGVDAYRKGVDLIHKQVLDLLRRRGVTPVEAVGKPFDPNVHQAVIHEVVPGHPEGEVVEEFRRGYKLRDRLLRPAMVKVAKA